MPVVGPSRKAPGIFHAFGFCGHGFQFGPIVGRIIADLALDGGSNLPIEAFSIARFRAED
ncbi:MAG: FAD-dependent oxidoreductase [Alphaproteobacteria bacterium]|nr:FAD-dependent oxidoreductase [Alphaproteobacteria bacterium]MDP6271204.1 FAD-dependent oxidoreductase [Alphaproteobacteria bacterium]